MKAKKRCQAVSPGAHLQCELHKSHLKRDYAVGILHPKHRVMNTTWSEGEGSTVEAITHQNSRSAMPTTDIKQSLFITVDEAHRLSTTNAGLGGEGSEAPDPELELRDWWFNKAHDEIELTVPKAIEYGSTDLIDIGLMLARTMRRTVTEEEAAELGVFFYLIGKIARWQSAIERGERPSDDTLLDIGVYVRMAQRIRDTGGWPGTKESK